MFGSKSRLTKEERAALSKPTAARRLKELQDLKAEVSVIQENNKRLEQEIKNSLDDLKTREAKVASREVELDELKNELKLKSETVVARWSLLKAKGLL